MENANQAPKESSSSSSSTTFTCMICCTPINLPEKKFKNHSFCTDCMIKYIKKNLDDNEYEFDCPDLTCDCLLEPLSCREQIGDQLFIKWCDVLCETSAGVDRVYCPNINCSALIINECGNGDSLKRCVCPNCKKPFCFQCRVAWHDGYTCDKSREMMDQNDVAFHDLCERNRWMRCPGCRHCVEHVDGCSTVQCRCGIEFCYKCGENRSNGLCKCERNPLLEIFLLLFVLLSLLPLAKAITDYMSGRLQ